VCNFFLKIININLLVALQHLNHLGLLLIIVLQNPPRFMNARVKIKHDNLGYPLKSFSLELFI